MSTFALFMKSNKVEKPHTFYAATTSLKDENGDPVKWELRPISSKENSRIRESCMKEIPVPGKPNVYRQRMETGKYITAMLVSSCVVPNLYDKELQDSYGVMTPEDLLFALVDDSGEYDKFAAFVQDFNGFNVSMEDKVNDAKN